MTESHKYTDWTHACRYRYIRDMDTSNQITQKSTGVTRETLFGKAQLATVLKIDRATVGKRLKDCPSPGTINSQAAYRLIDAMPLLFASTFTQADGEGKIKPADRKSLVEADIKIIQRDRELGNTVLVEEVREFLSGVFKDMDNRIAVWADEVEREVGLDEEQMTALNRQINEVRLMMTRDIVPPR